MASRYFYLARHGEAVEDGVLSEAGREQARLLGERLAGSPISVVHHSPLPRAAETARLIAGHLPHAEVHSSDLFGDYIPSVPARDTLPPVYASFLDGFTSAELAEGPPLAAAVVERHAVATEAETHELLVTHNFLIAWFVRHALDAPPARWMGLNQANCALTVILYRPELPPALLTFNDMSHLPPHLRWSGFPRELRV